MWELGFENLPKGVEVTIFSANRPAKGISLDSIKNIVRGEEASFLNLRVKYFDGDALVV